MKSSRALRWLLVLLLPLTLGLKFVVHSNDVVDEAKDRARDRVAAFLTRNHFNIVGIAEMTGEMPVVRATAGACYLLVGLASPRGWHRDMLNRIKTPDDSTFFVFRGKVYQEQPMWLTVSDFLWAKFLSQLGIKAYTTPVLGVIATKNCNAERLPWDEVR